MKAGLTEQPAKGLNRRLLRRCANSQQVRRDVNVTDCQDNVHKNHKESWLDGGSAKCLLGKHEDLRLFPALT